MPRKDIDFSKCCFYRLVCLDPTVTECYVGHTTNAVNRKRRHKNSCTDENAKGYNFRVYKFIREHGGWVNWEMKIHEYLAVANAVEARLREQHWSKHYKATLNSNVPGRTTAQYYRDHHTHLRKLQTDYQLRCEMSKHYTCLCGGRYTGINKYAHERTHLHRNWITRTNNPALLNE